MTDKPKPKRQWLQFSLRTLFVVVTVFCIWLGVITKKAREQRLAVEAIRAWGGSVFYEHESLAARGGGRAAAGVRRSDTPGPEWLRRLIGDEYFFTVARVVGIGSTVDDAGLEAIGRLTDVQELNLNYTDVTDAGLEHLNGLTNLKKLYLNDPKITNAGLVHMKALTQLDTLHLNNTQVTDAGLEHLKGMTDLNVLSISDTKVTDAGLEHLTGFAGLRYLNISYTQVTGEGVNKLEQALPNCRIIRQVDSQQALSPSRFIVPPTGVLRSRE